MSKEPRKPSDRIVWCDVETGGFEDESPLLEVAFIVTDSDLNLVDECATFESLICDVSIQFFMQNVWEGHHESGLIDDLIQVHKLSHEGCELPTSHSVENEVIEFLNSWGVHEGMEEKPPLAGSSVWFDRRRLERYMPRVAKLVSHRNIDVSTIRELQLRWGKEEHEPPKPGEAHRALNDIRESLELLRFFRKRGFIGGHPTRE